MICNGCGKDKSAKSYKKGYKTCKECQSISRSKRLADAASATVAAPSVTVLAQPVMLNMSKAQPTKAQTSVPKLIVEAASRLNKHRLDGKAMREFQSMATDYASKHEDDLKVTKYIESLEIYMDPTRSDNLRDSAHKKLEELQRTATHT